ncbi:MAG TPA: GapR family DNA-binding domain-containing protein, partial [Clostridia bacterium]|nr:GapR family DNA-binding domain-containing protein [Clostridia bacterium]
SKDKIPEDAVSVVIEGAELFLPLEELIDFEKEIERLEKEKTKLESEIKRVVGKLSNEGFVSKAPARLVDEEKQKQTKYEEMLAHVLERLNFLKNR